MKKCGFTLIELMVVISLLAIVGVFALANFRSFGEDQDLKSAALDLQSAFRQAQTSATANVRCQDGIGRFWRFSIYGPTDVRLRCFEYTIIPYHVVEIKKITLPSNIQIDSISGIPAGSCSSAPPFALSEVNFDSLTGNMTFASRPACTSLTLILKNTKTNNTKSIIIEQGGRVYEQ